MKRVSARIWYTIHPRTKARFIDSAPDVFTSMHNALILSHECKTDHIRTIEICLVIEKKLQQIVASQRGKA